MDRPAMPRLPHLEVSRLGFVLVAATFLSLINSASIFQRASEFAKAASIGDFVLHTFFEVALLWCTMVMLLLAMSFSKWLLKVGTVLLVCAGVVANYYVARLNIGIDTEVIRSILATDQQEMTEFVDPLSLVLLALVGGGVVATLAMTTIVSRKERVRPMVFAPRPLVVFSFVGAITLAAFTSHAAFGQYYAKQFFRSGSGHLRSRLA